MYRPIVTPVASSFVSNGSIRAWMTIGLIGVPSRTMRISCHAPVSTTSIDDTGGGRLTVGGGPQIAQHPAEQSGVCVHGQVGTVAYAGTAVELLAETGDVDGLDVDPDPAQGHGRGQLDVVDVLGQAGEGF